MAHILIDDISPIISYDVGAARSSFPVPFAFFENSNLVVTVGLDTLVLDTDYSVTGAGESTGGTVTLDTAVTSTTVVIERILPIERVTDFPNSGPFDIPGLNTQFDKIIAICQQLQAGISAAVQSVVDVIALFTTLINSDTTVTLFTTRNAIAGATVGAGVLYIRTAGYYLQGDGGDALYRRVSAEPSHAGKAQSANGIWFEIVGTELNARQFGVKADGTDETLLAQAAIDGPASVLTWPAGVIGIGAAGLTGKSNQVWRSNGSGVSIIRLLVDPTDDFVAFNGETNFEIRGLTLDYNNRSANTALLVTACSDFSIVENRIVNFTTFGIAVGSGCTDFRIERNLIQRAAPASTQNEAILVSNSGGTNSGGFITANRIKNSGMDFAGTFLLICHNHISGCGYGAGITIEQDANTRTNVMAANICEGSSLTIDAGGVYCAGIENWGSDSVLVANLLYANGGTGLDHGGARSALVGNVATGNGRATPLPGIGWRYGSSTYNAQDSTVVGNVSVDLGNLTQSYGLGVDSGNGIYQTLAGNSFKGATAPASTGSGIVRSFVGPALEGSTTFDPASLLTGTGAGNVFALAGAALGDKVECSFSNALQGVKLFAWVDSANSITFRFENHTGGTIDLASGTVRVTVHKHSDYANL